MRLANDPAAPGKLRLDATKRLPEVEQRMAGVRVARAQERVAPDVEARRREIDRILAEAAEELGVSVGDKEAVPNAVPESTDPETMGPPPVAASVPDYGISRDASSRTESEQPAVRLPDSQDAPGNSQREHLLSEGRALASAIRAQLGNMSQAPVHWHAGQKKLELLQADFLAWEREVNAHYPDTDTLKEFPDNRLRYVMQIVDQRGYFAQRRVATIDEQAFIAPQRGRTKVARVDGLWAVAGPGI
jgi:hypothetical protein